ncbi:MAG: lysostaphin resistance A-like protein [Polyangiales bacterium]
MGGYLKALLIAVLFWALLGVFMVLAGFIQLRSLSAPLHDAAEAAAQQPINFALVPAAACVVLFVIAFPRRRSDAGLLEAVHVRPLMGGIVAICFLGGACLQIPMAELGNLTQEIWPVSFDELARRHRFINPSTWWGGFSAMAALVLVAPVTEELLFRGWLLQDLKEQYGTKPALIWSSVLFGLVHGVAAMPYATLGGLVLGAVALRTKSTLGSIGMHAGVNALPLLLPVSLVRIEGFNNLSEDTEHISWWIILLALFGVLGSLKLLWRATEEPDA